MIEVREAEGHYEVFAQDRHWEVFEGRLGAQAAALALAAEIKAETGSLPEIQAPWPVYPPVISERARMQPCNSPTASSGNPTTT